jgi:hypothetical protein
MFIKLLMLAISIAFLYYYYYNYSNSSNSSTLPNSQQRDTPTKRDTPHRASQTQQSQTQQSQQLVKEFNQHAFQYLNEVPTGKEHFNNSVENSSSGNPFENKSPFENIKSPFENIKSTNTSIYAGDMGVPDSDVSTNKGSKDSFASFPF